MNTDTELRFIFQLVNTPPKVYSTAAVVSVNFLSGTTYSSSDRK